MSAAPHRARARTLTRALIAGAALSLTALITACASAPSWHPVTTAESQLLAVSRFQNFDAGERSFMTEVTVQGQSLKVAGAFDFAQHAGTATVTSGEQAPQGLLWNADAIAIAPLGADDALPTAPEAWTTRPLAPTASALDAVLASFALLGSDRPDNPLLVQQAGALWLGTEGSGDAALTLYVGPPSDTPLDAAAEQPTPETATVRYALDATGLMHRVELRIGTEWVAVNFDATSRVTVPGDLVNAVLGQAGH